MTLARLSLLIVALFSVLASVRAEVIPGFIDTVLIGNAGNANDSTGYGGVSYAYHIGAYEVTNAQYASFLRSVASVSDPHGLYNAEMDSSTHGGITRGGRAWQLYVHREEWLRKQAGEFRLFLGCGTFQQLADDRQY